MRASVDHAVPVVAPAAVKKPPSSDLAENPDSGENARQNQRSRIPATALLPPALLGVLFREFHGFCLFHDLGVRAQGIFSKILRVPNHPPSSNLNKVSSSPVPPHRLPGTEKSDLIQMIRSNTPLLPPSKSPVRGARIRFSITPRGSGASPRFSVTPVGALTPARPAVSQQERLQTITRILSVRRPPEGESRFVSKSWAYDVLQLRQSSCDLHDVKAAVKRLRIVVGLFRGMCEDTT